MEILDFIVKLAVIVLPLIFARNNVNVKKGNDLIRWQLIEQLAPIAFMAVESLKGFSSGKMSGEEAFKVFKGKLNSLLVAMGQPPIDKKEDVAIEKLAETHSQAYKASKANGAR